MHHTYQEEYPPTPPEYSTVFTDYVDDCLVNWISVDGYFEIFNAPPI
jgi:hypothetical protein